MEQIILQGLSIPGLIKLLSEVVEEKLLQLTKTEEPKSKTVYLSRVEVAEMLKISLPTLNEWSKLGTLQSYRIGNRILYKADEVEGSISAVKNLKYKRL
jgi:excisionase family DNA binding protein